MRKAFSSLLFVVAVGVVGTACTANGSARYSASAEMPSMVYIGPDVQVIEDYDEPVFYSANVYWRYNGGIWYQSRTYTGGWVTVSTPPPAIVRIQTPTMYVHYRASAHAEANAQGNGRAAEVQQEHRQEQADKREEKREDKQVREEVKEQKQEQKREEKREEKQDKHDDKQDKHDNGKHK